MTKSPKCALFSVDKLGGIEGFAARLRRLGWHIIASKETVEFLKRHAIDVEDIASFTGVTEEYGFPPTLHPKVEAALTTESPFRIDLVYDIPYPLQKGKDVGGRTLLALAAKGDRLAVLSPADMDRVISALEAAPSHAMIPDLLRAEMTAKVYAEIAGHYLELARSVPGSAYDGMLAQDAGLLANGENPYQIPAHLLDAGEADSLGLPRFEQLSGDKPCFTNLADLDWILQTLCLAAEAFRLEDGEVPHIAVAAKHGNACGMAVDRASCERTVERTLWGNPLAVWGGEFIANFRIDVGLAELLLKSEDRARKLGDAHWMLDVIAAPDLAPEAVALLGKRRARKLLRNAALADPQIRQRGWQYRHVRGGFLRQPPPTYVFDIRNVEGAGADVSTDVFASLVVAWSVAYSSNHGGNEVALATGGMLLGAGGGPSTVEAARVAVHRAQALAHDTRGAAFAADAFFPFTDAPLLLKEAGCSWGTAPGGGKNEGLVRRFFADNNMRVLWIPPQYRGFCRH